MGSVLIKGMKMPTWCNDCPFNDKEYDVCVATSDRRVINIPRWDEIRLSHREKWCPLVEVPTPHGRLIDADLVAQTHTSGSFDIAKVVKNAPTVIEAEAE